MLRVVCWGDAKGHAVLIVRYIHRYSRRYSGTVVNGRRTHRPCWYWKKVRMYGLADEMQEDRGASPFNY